MQDKGGIGSRGEIEMEIRDSEKKGEWETKGRWRERER